MRSWLIFGEIEEKTIYRSLPRKAMSPLFTRNYAKESNLDWSGGAAQTTGRYTAESRGPDQTKFYEQGGTWNSARP